MSNIPENLEAELERQSEEDTGIPITMTSSSSTEVKVDNLGDEPFAESADENYGSNS